MLGDVGDPLEVVVARVAEVRRAEAEEHRHLAKSTIFGSHNTSELESAQ